MQTFEYRFAMRKLIVVVHTSLDGFVAGTGGDLDGFEPGQENLEFVCRLTKKSDTAIFGRVSYALLNDYWSARKDDPDATWNEMVYSQWYNDAGKFVVSTTLQAACNATILRDQLEEEIRTLKAKPGKDILVFGSPSLSQTLLRLGLVDAYWVFVNPVIFGKGIPLFSGNEEMTRLKLVELASFANGEVALLYTLKT
jgi:dihydrofolate reductase